MIAEATELRSALVAEARSWIGTPYRTMGRVKGGGCDCGSFLLSVAVNCGLVKNEDLAVYSTDCWAHWTEEKYLLHIMRYSRLLLKAVAYRSTEFLPGTLLMMKTRNSSKYNHGGWVVEWPRIVHCVRPCVREIDATTDPMWSYREVEAYDLNAFRATP